MKFSGLKGLVLGALAVAVSWAAPAPALAGSGCSTIVTGAVLTAAQWNACFAAKQNELGYTPVNKAGDSMTGLLTTVAPTTTTAGFRLNPGTAPTVPTNGDIWTTSAGLYVQVNGSTIGPITGGAAGSFAGTSPITVSFPSGVVTYAFDFSVANVFTARQTINLSGSTTPTPITGAGLVVNPASATVGRVQVNAYGAIASFTGAVYAGTAAAPTQVLSGTQLTGINAYAYTGSALVGPIGSFRLYAAENITATAWGTKACIATVPLTTAVLTDSLCQQNSGGVTVGSPTGGDKGAGTINAAGTIYINGTALSASAANLTVGTSTITSGTTTRVLYDNGGVVGETSALVTNGSSTVGVVSASFGLSGNISTTAWTTSGVRYKNVAATLTDTSSSGTVATAYTDLWGGNTIAASSATVFTNYFTAYFTAPTTGTNVTFTNSWALGADSVKIGTSNQMTVSTAGAVTMGGILTLSDGTKSAPSWGTTTSTAGGSYYNSTFGALVLANGNQDVLGWKAGAVQFASNVPIYWSSGAAGTLVATGDVNINRSAAGILQIGTTSANSLGSISLTGVAATGTVQDVSGGYYRLTGASGATTTLKFASTAFMGWAATDSNTGTTDTVLSRVSAGVVGVGLTASGQVTGGLSAATVLTGAGASNSVTGLQVGAANFGIWSNGGYMDFSVGGTSAVAFTASSFNWKSSMVAGFSSGAPDGANCDVCLTRAAAASLQHGAADAAVAVAQTIRVQSVVAGTAAASGANWTFIGSLPTGTGTSGDIIFQTGVKTGSGTTQGTATTAMTIKGETQQVNFAGTIFVPSNVYSGNTVANPYIVMNVNVNGGIDVMSTGRFGFSSTASAAATTDAAFSRISAGVIGVGTGAVGSVAGTLTLATIINGGITTDSGHTDSTVCQDTTSHQYYFGSGALGVCLGTSGRQFKTEITPMAAGLDDLMKVDFVNYRYRAGYGDGGARKQYGTTAQNVEAAIPDLARQNANGETINFDSGALLFVGLRAIQQLKAENDNIKASNDNLRAEIETLKRASR